MKNLKIYTAGPISGMTYDESVSYFNSFASKLHIMGYKVFTPLTGKAYLRNELKLRSHGYGQPLSTNHAIVGRDKWMVEQSDIILCNLLHCQGRVSIGSVMELAWASHFNKHIIVVMDKENIHQHAFVLEAADVVFETEEEALDYLEILIG